MRALIQRVSRASVDIDGETVGRIDQGLLALVGVAAILSAFFEAGLAPADVLTKTNSSPVASSSNEGFVTK
mgnify:CR=1 FL=1